jgi:transposase
VARRYGLHASQLFVWRQQLHRGTSSAAGTIAGPGFVPVLMAEGDAPPAEAVGRMEIALGPAVVRVGSDVDAAALRRVLDVVRDLA